MLYHVKRLWLCSRSLQVCTVVFVIGFGWKSVAEAGGQGMSLPLWLGGGQDSGLMDKAKKVADKTLDTTMKGVDVADTVIDTGKKIVGGVSDVVDDIFGGKTTPAP